MDEASVEKPSETQNQASLAASLESVIQADAEKNAKRPRPPAKRPRGRPPKPRPAEILAPAEGAPVDPGEVPADLKPILQGAVALPFAIAAEYTGCEALSLSEKEGECIVPQVDAVLKRYFPNLANSPQGALGLLAGSIFTLSVTKYMAYRAWQAEQAEKAQPAPAKPADRPANPGAFPISAV